LAPLSLVDRSAVSSTGGLFAFVIGPSISWPILAIQGSPSIAAMAALKAMEGVNLRMVPEPKKAGVMGRPQLLYLMAAQ